MRTPEYRVGQPIPNWPEFTSDLSLLEWYMQVVNGNVVSSKRQVAVLMFSALGMPMMTFSFRDAYPIKWVGPSLNTEQNSVAFHGSKTQPPYLFDEELYGTIRRC